MNPFVGEELQCKMEHGNVHDIYAVAVTQDVVVGHLLRNISIPCHLFLHKGGIISCVVNGARRYPTDLVQGGLEVPGHLIFQGSPRDVDKMKKMLQEQPEVGQEEQKKEQTPVQKQLEPDQQNT